MEESRDPPRAPSGLVNFLGAWELIDLEIDLAIVAFCIIFVIGYAIYRFLFPRRPKIKVADHFTDGDTACQLMSAGFASIPGVGEGVAQLNAISDEIARETGIVNGLLAKHTSVTREINAIPAVVQLSQRIKKCKAAVAAAAWKRAMRAF